MATWEQVRTTAMALPEVDEHPSYGGLPSWRVKGKGFCWERPLRPRDLAELGDRATAGPVLGVSVADTAVKDELVAGGDEVFFTVSHLDGYPAVLVRLDRIRVAELRPLLHDAWRARAPARLRKEHPDL